MGPKKRRSSPWLLLAFSGLLLLAPSSVTRRTQLAGMSAFVPVRHATLWSLGLLGRPFSASGEADTLRTENDFLKDQVAKLTQENRRLSQQRDEALGMKALVRDRNFRLVTADVIFPTDSSPWRKSLAIAVGTKDGVEKGMLVLYNSQVVGRVSEAGSRTSRIQTVTDPGFRAGAVAVPRTTAAGVAFSERHVGVYEGTSGQNGQLKWFAGDLPVENGAAVLTTEDPANGVPRGLTLGRVSSVGLGRGAFPKVDVEPLLDFRALEHVMILVPPAELLPASGGR
jgi:cell shape-determining protein MreC